MVTSSLFSSLSSHPTVRSRVFTLLLNKYTLVAIVFIALRLNEKKTKANVKGQDGHLEDSTSNKSRNKRMLRDDDDIDTELEPVEFESDDDQHSWVVQSGSEVKR